MMAICPAGPPKEMKPSLTQKRRASANETLRRAGPESSSGLPPPMRSPAPFAATRDSLSTGYLLYYGERIIASLRHRRQPYGTQGGHPPALRACRRGGSSHLRQDYAPSFERENLQAYGNDQGLLAESPRSRRCNRRRISASARGR